MKFFLKNSKNLFENFVPGKMRFENFSEKLLFRIFLSKFVWIFFETKIFGKKVSRKNFANNVCTIAVEVRR